MIYEANIYQMTVEEHVFWIAESKSLKGCVGQGDTSDEAIKELEQNEQEWIATAKEVGIPIPLPIAKAPIQHNGKFALRLAPNVYNESSLIAEELGISMNQYFNNAIVSYNAASNSFLRKPIFTEINGDSSSKIVNFSLKAPSHKPIKIRSITEEPEEM